MSSTEVRKDKSVRRMAKRLYGHVLKKSKFLNDNPEILEEIIQKKLLT